MDSPAWHLVQVLATLVGPDGHTPAIEGFAEKARPLTAAEKAMIREGARRQNEAVAKKQLGVEHWVHDVDWLEPCGAERGRKQAGTRDRLRFGRHDVRSRSVQAQTQHRTCQRT